LSVLDLTKDKHFHVKHYRIRRTNQGMYYISSKTTFGSLQDLVEHYQSKKTETNETNVDLILFFFV